MNGPRRPTLSLTLQAAVLLAVALPSTTSAGGTAPRPAGIDRQLEAWRNVLRAESAPTRRRRDSIERLGLLGTAGDFDMLTALASSGGFAAEPELAKAACISITQLGRPRPRRTADDEAYLVTILGEPPCPTASLGPWAALALAETGRPSAMAVATASVDGLFQDEPDQEWFRSWLEWRYSYATRGVAGYIEAMRSESPLKREWGFQMLRADRSEASTEALMNSRLNIIEKLETTDCIDAWGGACDTLRQRWAWVYRHTAGVLHERGAIVRFDAHHDIANRVDWLLRRKQTLAHP